ncbi:MAG TPA: hypothetical protein VHD60_02910 [Candidatus Saccharimonadales bacterium]|nr:hypothetical protein [Candidatus Saccharimonadales bacterium]
MSKDINLNIDFKTLPQQLAKVIAQASHYAVFIFFLLLAAVYGFVLWRINVFSNAQPSPDTSTTQVQVTPVPHIDQNVVSQLEKLKDNSVSVKALFDKARTNPFQE